MQEVNNKIKKLEKFSSESKNNDPERLETKINKNISDFVRDLCERFQNENEYTNFRISNPDYLEPLRRILVENDFRDDPEINPDWVSLWQTIIFQIIDDLYINEIIKPKVHSEFFEDEEILRKIGTFYSYYSHSRSWEGGFKFTPIATYAQIFKSFSWFYLENAMKVLDKRNEGILIYHILHEEMFQFSRKALVSHSLEWKIFERRLFSNKFLNIIDHVEDGTEIVDDAKYFLSRILDLEQSFYNEEDMNLKDTIAKFSFCALNFLENYVDQGILRKIMSSEEIFEKLQFKWNPFYNTISPFIMIWNEFLKCLLKIKNKFGLFKKNRDLSELKLEIVNHGMVVKSLEEFAKSYAVFLEGSMNIDLELKKVLFSNYINNYVEERKNMRRNLWSAIHEKFGMISWVKAQETLQIYLTQENIYDCPIFQEMRRIQNIYINVHPERNLQPN